MNNVILRLLVYYGVAVSISVAIVNSFPIVEQALDHERDRHILATAQGLPSAAALPTTRDLLEMEKAIAIGSSMIIALLLSLPGVWVYSWTSRKKYYDRTFAQSLLVFPIAVALVVFLVKGSLALAFSLAGIVAAVRFRNVLPQTRDAIFLFMAIGIGLAVGVQLAVVALMASIVFNFTVIGMSVVDFGRAPSTLDGWTLRRPVKKVKPPAEPPAPELGPGS